MKRFRGSAFFLGLVLAAASAFAQTAATPAASPAPTAGFRAEFLNELAGVEKRFVGLAEAMPADKYTWRPAEGVRSVSEVYMHVAAANYNIPRLLGTPPPAGFNARGFDTSVTDKAKVIETLKQSLAHLRQAVLNMSEADGEKKLKWFGAENTYRGVLLFIIRHMAEHLGQSIAYARINGVVPPWTEEQQRQQQQKPKP
ncbi:MAG: DinB family protein [Candidatus Acidiferrales bacterium]|jgi:uncharacterized damage-inducible protein DinB